MVNQRRRTAVTIPGAKKLPAVRLAAESKALLYKTPLPKLLVPAKDEATSPIGQMLIPLTVFGGILILGYALFGPIFHCLALKPSTQTTERTQSHTEIGGAPLWKSIESTITETILDPNMRQKTLESLKEIPKIEMAILNDPRPAEAADPTKPTETPGPIPGQ